MKKFTWVCYSVFTVNHGKRPVSRKILMIQLTDENFFENFTVLSWRRENNRLQIARQEESEKDKPPPPEPKFPPVPESFMTPKQDGQRSPSFFEVLTPKKKEELYVEVLYTIKHKLGANSSNYAAYTEDMYEYARETFQMSDEEHAKFMAVAQEEKPPIPVLNVTVVEAQGLEAKDPNGFSDPYCMLGIQPDAEARRADGEDDSGTRRSLKRFGASFKKRDRKNPALNSETLPAKLIRTTSVKNATLNPKWREKFRLDIDDVRSDRLHLDIWDHDDETSVFDAAKKLNEVSNLKGLGRYFKEVAQSARTSIGENQDDFLGCVNIPLDEISAAGVDRWFTLQGRSHRSNVQGQIHLKLQLGTREDRGITSGDDNLREVLEHQQLIYIFVDYELRNFQGPSYEWPGDLPQQALTILHQHAIQGDITELQQSVCQWVAYYRKHREVTLDYALIYQQLDELNTSWDRNEEALTMEEETDTADTFNEFSERCIELLRQHRKYFPPHNAHAWHKLKFLLKCVSFLYSMNAFKSCFPFRNELHVEVTGNLKRGTMEWMQEIQQRFHRDPQIGGNSIRTLIKFIDLLNIDLQKATSHYCHLFESIVRVNYSALVFKQMGKQLYEEISKRIGRKALQEINNSQTLVTAQNRDYINKFLSQMSETDVFELFLVLQEFSRFKDCLPKEDQSSLIIANCHVWFADAVNQWFSVAKTKVRGRIYHAFEHDKALMENKSPTKELKPTNKSQQSQLAPLRIKYSVSAIDTVLSFIQLKEFWHQLAWPDKCSSYPYVLSIVQAIASGVVLYCNLIWKRLRDDSSCFSDRGRIELSNKVLLYINNMEYVLDGLKNLDKDLDTEAMFRAIEMREGQKVSQNCRCELENLFYDAQDHVHHKIQSVVNNIADQMRPAIQKLMFHLAWAPEKLESEKCVAPLLEYLEKTFREMNSNFLKPTFQRLMLSIWDQVLSEISAMTRSNIGKEKSPFFHRLFTSLHMLADFFHRDEYMLPVSEVQNAIYRELEKELSLQKAETTQLIDMYYLQRMEDQNKLHHAPFGSLTVNAYYDVMKQSVCVEVISAKDLIPCDPNGLSDPFVILQLVPKHLFPNSSTYKTKTHMRTLHPVFQEYFEWPVKWEICGANSAAVSFVVMDYDYMRKNDFEGEAYLALHALAGADEERTSEPIELVLMSPSNKSDILATLAVRTWDKQAMELLRQEKRKHS